MINFYFKYDLSIYRIVFEVPDYGGLRELGNFSEFRMRFPIPKGI